MKIGCIFFFKTMYEKKQYGLGYIRNTRFELLHDNTVAFTEFWLAASSSSGYMAFNFNLECRGFPSRTDV